MPARNTPVLQPRSRPPIRSGAFLGIAVVSACAAVCRASRCCIENTIAAAAELMMMKALTSIEPGLHRRNTLDGICPIRMAKGRSNGVAHPCFRQENANAPPSGCTKVASIGERFVERKSSLLRRLEVLRSVKRHMLSSTWRRRSNCAAMPASLDETADSSASLRLISRRRNLTFKFSFARHMLNLDKKYLCEWGT